MHTPRRFPYRKKILTPPQAPGSFCFSLVCCCLFAAALLAGCRKAGGFVLFFEIPDLWDGTVAAGFAGGSGSAADPYRIYMSTQLAYLAQEVNAGNDFAGKQVTLARNLNLDSRAWTAIGTATRPFRGAFDGAGHIIYNLTVNKPALDYQGLFGVIDGAVIRKLGLEHVNVRGRNYTGGIAGQVSGGSSIADSYSTGTVGGIGFVGGVAGEVTGSSIAASYSTGTVSSGAGNYAGGVAGDVITGSIAASYSTGTVGGTLYVGGVVGNAGNNSHIADSYSTGNVGGALYIGGVAGYVYTSTIEKSYSTGTVGGTGLYVGGVAGEVDGSTSRIEDCAALNPAVTATSDAGRVVGSISGGATNFPGNAAWNGMTLAGGTIVDTSDEDGTAITTAQVRNGAGLPPALKTAPWVYTPGTLPILNGLAGQTGALPAHL